MFYDNLQIACERKNTNVTSAVKACGGSNNGTSWRKGGVPNSDMVVKLAKYLETTTDFLLTGVESVPITDVEYTEDEINLIREYRKLNFRGKTAVNNKLLEEQTKNKK